MKVRTHAFGLGLLLSGAIAAAAPAGPAANVTAERLGKAEKEPSQWMTYGGTYSEQRFSRLKKIDSTNVPTLGLKWFADYETNQNQHGSPLYVDGQAKDHPKQRGETPRLLARERLLPHPFPTPFR